MGMGGPQASQRSQCYARPTHRVLSKWGRRVDTITWARSHLQSLDKLADELREKYIDGKGRSINAVFVEFDSYANA